MLLQRPRCVNCFGHRMGGPPKALTVIRAPAILVLVGGRGVMCPLFREVFVPIYEYECAKCGHEFEILQAADEKPSCPKCGSRRLKKQFSVFATAGSEDAMPSCAGSTPCCSRATCDSGQCPYIR